METVLVCPRAIAAQKIVALVAAALDGNAGIITMLTVSRTVFAVIAGD